MAQDSPLSNEAKNFRDRIQQPHKQVDPCFMTGKACVYSEIISREVKERRQSTKFSGFMIMPFRQNVQVFFQNCFTPFIHSHYSLSRDLTLNRADEVRRPGVIICEGICKRIQESDFVVSDVSLPNPNVFYEMGLAYGLRQKIVVIYHSEAVFGKEMTDSMRALGCTAFEYQDLDPIETRLSSFIWQNNYRRPDSSRGKTRMLFYEQCICDNSNEKESDDGDISLTFETHARSAIGLAVGKIYDTLSANPDSSRVIESYFSVIANLKNTDVVRHDHPLSQIQQQVDDCYCLFVRTGKNCHPMSYFWLGYCHALGKNVVPITIINNPNDSVDDLAFDIRAQRHMTFVRKKPELLEREIHETLRIMITSDFEEWSKRRFWNEMIGSGGEISIFTGALHNKDYDREMIGDWDLRAVSELTSYFGRHHHRFKIETPIYPPDRASQGPELAESEEFKKDYVDQVLQMIKNKNCILIASPDVNPLTEIVLGVIYGVPRTYWFKEPADPKRFPTAIISFKERGPSQGQVERPSADRTLRAFYKEEVTSEPAKRGFICSLIRDGRCEDSFISQTDKNEREFDTYAHLAVVPNPFVDAGLGRRYIIILNGVSGPATFALTHTLTGGVGKEFVDYDEREFKAEAESETVLSRILYEIESHQPSSGRDQPVAVECFIKVKVGPARETKLDAPEGKILSNMSDWRRIRKWGLDTRALVDKMKITPLPTDGSSVN